MCSIFVWHNFLLKYEPGIKDKELYDKEQKIYTVFFIIIFFFALKEFSPEIFPKVLTEGNS